MADKITRQTVNGTTIENELVDFQHGEIQNSPHGLAEVVFPKAFKRKPDVVVMNNSGCNIPRPGTTKMQTPTGFRYHFGGDSTDVPTAKWIAIDRDD